MRIRDLGPATVAVDGREVTLSGAKLTAILAVLALHANRRVSVDALVDAVWGPDAGPDRVPTLESHIWRLRRILEPGRARGGAPQVLVNDAAGYRLLVLADQLDSTRFEKLAEDARELVAFADFGRALVLADEALGLWRGPLDSPVYQSSTLQPVVARLNEERRQLAARRIDALLGTGAAAQALSDLDTLLGKSPFDERLWAARMLALHRLGRTQEALQSYQDARTRLRDEVGIDPGAELISLQRRILGGDPTLIEAAPPEHPAEHPPEQSDRRLARATNISLPSPLTPLLGRDETVGRLAGLMDTHRLITITGAAGCGKTRLAVEVARRKSSRFPDGTWLVDLALVEEQSLVADVVLSTIGVAPPASGTALEGLRAYCRDRTMLLVLDNCEHVLGAATDAARTVVGAGDSVVLATSREPLDIPGEVLWTLGPLALPDAPGATSAELPADAAAAPAVALFLDRMRSAGRHPDPSAAELRVVVEICTALDGLPLAIELAAARVRSATLREIAADVMRDPSGLRRLGRSNGAVPVTIRDSIDTGHQQLTASERAVHRRLATLPGAFTRDIAAAVSVGPPVEAGDVTYLLDSLTHRSLLTCISAGRPGGPTLFRQLATVRGHATHALHAAAEAADAAHRRDDWVSTFVAERPRIAHADSAGWYPAAVDALPTMRATLEHLLVREPVPAGARLVSRLTMFWYFRGRLAEGVRWAEIAGRSDVGDAITALLVDIAVAAGDAVRGRADLAAPRVERMLARLAALDVQSIDPARLIELGDLYAPLAVALNPAAPPAILAALGRSAAELASVAQDPGLVVLGNALACAAGAHRTDPRTTAATCADVYEQALGVGHLFAALIAGGTAIALALAARDPGGRVWVQRNHHLHRQQGGTQNGLLLENSANFAAFGADRTAAVRFLAASRAQARRAGTTWPRNAVTRATRAELERTLTRAEFDRAWREGGSLGVLSASDAPA